MGDDRPAVHLALIDLLGAVIEARRVAEAHRVGGGEQAEARMRADDALLVEQGQAAGDLQHALDHEHHVRAAGIVLVEHQRDVVLQRPGQDAVLEGGDLLAVLQDDGVLADEVDARDVTVEVDPDAGPVQPRRDLLDMGRFTGAVIARDHDAAVLGEARQDRQRGLAVEDVVGVEVRHVLLGLREGRDLEVEVDAEHLADGDLTVGQGSGRFVGQHTGPHRCGRQGHRAARSRCASSRDRRVYGPQGRLP